ncbi:MAG: polysaccharide deacetylase family protein [Chloroflexia bacterium]|nr:polysaccharide deacetylase family protein [Chloroflexia bacterium]
MLKFFSITILFGLSLLVSLLLPFPFLYKILISTSLTTFYSGILIWGASSINSQLFMHTICKNNNEKLVAITFDDGPDESNTEEILDVLSKYNSKASFFFIGSKIEKHQELVIKAHKNHHTIGNHTFTHANNFPVKSKRAIKAEIEKTQECIKSVTGKENVYFRPPFGVTNPNIAKAIKGMNLEVIGWSIRSFDTMHKSKEQTLKRVISKIKGGDIYIVA